MFILSISQNIKVSVIVLVLQFYNKIIEKLCTLGTAAGAVVYGFCMCTEVRRTALQTDE